MPSLTLGRFVKTALGYARLTVVVGWRCASLKARKKALADDANTVLVSAASAWEIANKHRLGKLPGAEGAVREFAALVAADGFSHLAVSYRHVLSAVGLDAAHRDPFDRMLAAQASIEDALLVTNDAALKYFRLKCYW